jgi:hypothetical protein
VYVNVTVTRPSLPGHRMNCGKYFSKVERRGMANSRGGNTPRRRCRATGRHAGSTQRRRPCCWQASGVIRSAISHVKRQSESCKQDRRFQSLPVHVARNPLPLFTICDSHSAISSRSLPPSTVRISSWESGHTEMPSFPSCCSGDDALRRGDNASAKWQCLAVLAGN